MSEQIILRAAVPADEPFLFRLQKLTTARYLNRPDYPINQATHYSRAPFRFDNLSIIYRGIEAIGFFRASRSETAWFIEQILLLPDCQGSGIGEKIISAFLAEAKEANMSVSLNVLRDNPALRLYERLGFKVITKTELEVSMICHP